MSDVAALIKREVEAWKDAHVTPSVETASDVSNGHCKAFARDIKRKLGRGKIHSYGYDEGGYVSHAHVWLEVNGKHYDAECPDGVQHPSELPIFRRAGIDPTEQ